MLNFTSMVGRSVGSRTWRMPKSFPTASKAVATWCCKHRNLATFGTTWSLTSCHTSIVTIGNGTGGRTSGSWSRGLDGLVMFYHLSSFFITWTRRHYSEVGQNQPVFVSFDLMGLLGPTVQHTPVLSSKTSRGSSLSLAPARHTETLAANRKISYCYIGFVTPDRRSSTRADAEERTHL